MIEVERIDDATYTIRITGSAQVELRDNHRGLTPVEALEYILADALSGWDGYDLDDLDGDVPF